MGCFLPGRSLGLLLLLLLLAGHRSLAVPALLLAIVGRRGRSTAAAAAGILGLAATGGMAEGLQDLALGVGGQGGAEGPVPEEGDDLVVGRRASRAAAVSARTAARAGPLGRVPHQLEAEGRILGQEPDQLGPEGRRVVAAHGPYLGLLQLLAALGGAVAVSDVGTVVAGEGGEGGRGGADKLGPEGREAGGAVEVEARVALRRRLGRLLGLGLELQGLGLGLLHLEGLYLVLVLLLHLLELLLLAGPVLLGAEVGEEGGHGPGVGVVGRADEGGDGGGREGLFGRSLLLAAAAALVGRPKLVQGRHELFRHIAIAAAATTAAAAATTTKAGQEAAAEQASAMAATGTAAAAAGRCLVAALLEHGPEELHELPLLLVGDGAAAPLGQDGLDAPGGALEQDGQEGVGPERRDGLGAPPLQLGVGGRRGAAGARAGARAGRPALHPGRPALSAGLEAAEGGHAGQALAGAEDGAEGGTAAGAAAGGAAAGRPGGRGAVRRRRHAVARGGRGGAGQAHPVEQRAAAPSRGGRGGRQEVVEEVHPVGRSVGRGTFRAPAGPSPRTSGLLKVKLPNTKRYRHSCVRDRPQSQAMAVRASSWAPFAFRWSTTTGTLPYPRSKATWNIASVRS